MDGLNNTGNFITKLFETLNTELFDVLSPIQDIAIVLAGIGVFIYLAQVLLPLIERNEPIQLYPLLKPLFVAIVVTNFNVVTGLLDGVLSGINSSIDVQHNMPTESFPDFNEAQKRNKERLEAEFASLHENDDRGWLGRTSERIFYSLTGIHYNQLGDQLILYIKYQVLFPALSWLSTMLGGIAYIVIIMMSKFYLLFLAIFGPLSFALSQFSYFQSSFSSWMSRYISVGLWPAMANLLKYMNSQVFHLMNGYLGDSFDGAMILFLILIVMSYLYLQIPEISEYIVTSGGVGGLNQSMLRSVKRSAKISGTVTAAPLSVAGGLAAGEMMGHKSGMLSSKGEQMRYNLYSRMGEKTGALGAINRKAQEFGVSMGRIRRESVDNIISKVKKETPQERSARIARRSEEREKRYAQFTAPLKKNLRQKAKHSISLKKRGYNLSSEQEEMIRRYKMGEYKGKGKFVVLPEHQKREQIQELENYVTKGLSQGQRIYHQKNANKSGVWHPPMPFK